MNLLCSDLEGVFVPEIWIQVALKTGIEELKLTTRDISDYHILMQKRLAIMADNGLTIHDIRDVIASVDPLDGAVDVLDWIREQTQIIILSDTFEEFAKPIMKKLNYPTLLCNSLTVADDGRIVDYNIRQESQKKQAVKAFKGLKYRVIAFGDSYNDTDMLLAADHGFLFNPPDAVTADFPSLPVTRNYRELKEMIRTFL